MTVSVTEPEELVLTAGKRDSRAVVRIDRKSGSELDSSHVHFVNSGQYKGLLINKHALSPENGDSAEARLEFLAYLVKHGPTEEPLQDAWVMRFWFRGKPDGLSKKKAFTNYFQELMNPTDFPKNYMSFIKKAMLLLKNYLLIRSVELEVQPIQNVAVQQSNPPIKSFVSLFTPDIYQYNFVPEISMSNKTFLTFMIKAKCDAHIALSAIYGELHKKTVEVVIGAEGNTRSMIKDGVEGSVRSDALTANVLSGSELRYFWLSWGDFHIEVGRGSNYGEGTFLEWRLPSNKQFPITSLAVATDNTSHGQFEFAELLEVETDYSRNAKKTRFQQQLMRMAKKQRLLHALEDVYPNTLAVNDILREPVGRTLDPGSLVIMLKDLEKLHHIREVEVGRWMRIQHETQNGVAGHDLKLVRDMPRLNANQQPTIAIITSLYCEKLAVDAMIDEKTTFVKYKTEVRRSFVGESQVYTVGNIGRFRVVSTKLSRNTLSSHTARISAENTVTRLLGTFNAVEHVLLVGVAGGTTCTETSQQARLGDVVVSTPGDKTDPLYIHCSGVQKPSPSRSFVYNTRVFDCQNKTLQNVVTSLRSIVQTEWMNPKPWHKYIETGLEVLSTQETNFKRPIEKKDENHKIAGTVEEFLRHCANRAQSSMNKTEERFGVSDIRYGVIGGGKLVSRAECLRKEFTAQHNILAMDLDCEAVLESLEGNRNDSFLVIRGICDGVNGSRKQWQAYAALAAAAYMKAVVMAL